MLRYYVLCFYQAHWFTRLICPSQVLAQLPQASTRQSSAILSSIEFDRDAQFFATAGVSKRISIYDFASVLANPYSDVHCPALELGTRSKLSCLSWHRYVKSNLISSDYEGVLPAGRDTTCLITCLSPSTAIASHVALHQQFVPECSSA